MANLMPQTVSVRDIQRNYRQIFDRVQKTGRPIVVLKNNQPEVVISSIKKLEELEKKLRKWEEREALEALRVYEKEKRTGELKLLRGSLVDLWQRTHED